MYRQYENPYNLEKQLEELKKEYHSAVEANADEETLIDLAENIAAQFSLLTSGGSDFHGSVKPDISLGVGKGNLCIPISKYYALQALHGELPNK